MNKFKLEFAKPGWFIYAAIPVLLLVVYWLTQIWLGPSVSGFPVVKAELVQTVAASGKIQGPVRIEVISKINGKVASIPVSSGETVRAGQTLIVLENKAERANSEKARVALVQATARLRKITELTQSGSAQSLLKAQTTLDKARKQHARTSELAQKGYVGQDQLSDSLRNLAIAQSQLATVQFQAKASRGNGSDYALAEAALNKARANERVAREQLGNTMIKAVADGIVIASHIEQGSEVLEGKTLMVLSAGGKTQLIARTDGKNFPYLKPGQQAVVVADANAGQRFNAELSNVNPALDALGDPVELMFDIAAPPDYLRQDMKVSLDIEVARRTDALCLATVAIRDEAGAEPWV
ncbi:MAG: efflux RND transporter periplasmic adaptor subunit, partial [Gallionellaceae bacterium]